MSQTKTIFAIATLVAAVGTIGIIAGAPAADAKQARAPGQGIQGCNPGLHDCAPPGQTPFNNPGQCQKASQEPPFDSPKEDAHEVCHTSI